jgi:hypothetical protein
MVSRELMWGMVTLVFAVIPMVGQSLADQQSRLCKGGPLCVPAAHQKNCAKRPSVCGYPDVNNTGPVEGTVLRHVPQDVSSGEGWMWEPAMGRLRVTGAGVTIEGMEVRGQVVIDAPNVTLRNSKVLVCNVDSIVAIRAGRRIDGYNADGAHIEKNLLGCDGPADERPDRGVSDVYGEARRVIVRENNIWNVSNGVTIEREGLVQRNFVHDLGHRLGDHHSGLSNHGGAMDVVFDFNTVLLSQEGVSGAIVVYSDFSPARNVTISRNLVSGGSYCIYGGESGAFAPAKGAIRIVNNRFSKIYGKNGNCGIYGQIATFAPAESDGWSGNIWDEDLRPLRENLAAPRVQGSTPFNAPYMRQ